jgi:putative transposase
MVSYKLDKGRNSVYSMYYRFIKVVKYRKNVFIDDAIVDFLKMKIRGISEAFNVDVL